MLIFEGGLLRGKEGRLRLNQVFEARFGAAGGFDGGNGRTSGTLLFLNPTSSSAVNHGQTGFKVNSTIWN